MILQLVAKVLAWRAKGYVRRYFARHPEVRLVVVVGSVGKTSTKAAVATVLAEEYRVRASKGNLNTEIAVPFSVMGVEYPDYGEVRSVAVWRRAFSEMRRKARVRDDVEVIVQELGVDRPGEMAKFSKFLRADVAVVTAVTPEHMEFFRDMDTVAREETRVGEFSERVLVNGAATAEKYIPAGAVVYGEGGDYAPGDIKGVKLQTIGGVAEQIALGAYAVGDMMGMSRGRILSGLGKLVAEPGRMNVLPGKKGAVIIDDSYNASPEAVRAALATLYGMKATRRIAILGSMNELGEESGRYHREIGEGLDAGKLDALVVVGEEAIKHLAPAARKVKNIVVAEDARRAGEAVLPMLGKGTVVLVKGSQGGIYLEEAVKVLLAKWEDEKRLVRQSEAWMRRKNAQT